MASELPWALDINTPDSVPILREENKVTGQIEPKGDGNLVLARVVGGNGVIIDGDIMLKVLRVDGRNRAMLGFEAPLDRNIVRNELLDREGDEGHRAHSGSKERR